jgi:hypothetical protein
MTKLDMHRAMGAHNAPIPERASEDSFEYYDKMSKPLDEGGDAAIWVTFVKPVESGQGWRSGPGHPTLAADPSAREHLDPAHPDPVCAHRYFTNHPRRSGTADIYVLWGFVSRQRPFCANPLDNK